MKQTPAFDQNYGIIKEQLIALKGQNITVTEYKTKNKIITKKGLLTLVSDNLFCFEVPLGKVHSESCSYTFYDIKMGKISIKELKLDLE